jgi:hypothetical protein
VNVNVTTTMGSVTGSSQFYNFPKLMTTSCVKVGSETSEGGIRPPPYATVRGILQRIAKHRSGLRHYKNLWGGGDEKRSQC